MSDKNKLREYIKWLDSLLRSMDINLSKENPDNVWKHSGYKEYARKFRQIVTLIMKDIEIPPIIDVYDDEKMPAAASTIAIQQKGIFESVHANASILKGYFESKLGTVDDEFASLKDFLQSRLRSAILKKPEQERDVQDSLEQLLIGRGLIKGQDYDRETGRVKVSTKEVIPDFIIPKLSLAIELKFIKEKLRVKTAVDEINADILSYSKLYQRLLFIVYDMGFIRDELEFRHDLEATDSISVIIVKN